MSRHLPVHLRIDTALDGHFPKEGVFLLRSMAGGWTKRFWDPQYDAVCGAYKPARMVARPSLDRVTCNRCKAYIARFIR